MPHTSSRRAAKSRVASSSTSSRYTHSTAPSSVSMSPPHRRYHVKGDTNVAIRLRKGITVNNHTGAFDDHDDDFTDEDSAGIQVVSVSDDEYSTSEGSEEDDDEEEEDEEDDEEDDDEEEDGEDEGSWDYIEDEINPSDSASRPRVVKHHSAPHHAIPHHHAVAHRAIPPPSIAPSRGPRTKVSHHERASSRHAAPVPDPPSRHESHSRSRSRSKLERVRRPRRSRPQSVPQEPLDVEDDDDYPYPPPPPQMRPGPPPGHPSAGWGHIPQPTPNGYAPSMISDPRFQYGFPGGAQSPTGQMVPFGHEPHGAYAQNPFAPNGQNPFTGPPSAADPRAGYFPDYQDPRHQDPRQQDPRDPRQGRRGHRNSMPPAPPSGEMMPFSPMGYYPPYGAPPASFPATTASSLEARNSKTPP
ncbi:hypothetical protein PTT_09806 [Pyrenophora teres f. teres 0-1]|uniref:Uncharacterized protein n=1 Tax=Pyrenophora teres f. teres (strain 0-1) TaxID=861557 RepID=E3RMS9_PYRTT|nr:hypothetical protein PTT_09806 [Pyrenophora teres f. teres 0-1]